MSYLGTSSGISCLTLNKQGHPTNYLHSTNYLLRLVVFTWSDFKQSQFVIGRLACSVSPPSDAKGILAIENEHKNISTWYKFLNSGLNHTNFQIVMTRLLCCESERKSNFVAEKLDLEYLLCTSPVGFSGAYPFCSAGSWVTALKKSTAGNLRPRAWERGSDSCFCDPT